MAQGSRAGQPGADPSESHLLRTMEIGDVLTYRGRSYYLRGLEPMSVPARLADLEDCETGEQVRAPVSDLEPRFDEDDHS